MAQDLLRFKKGAHAGLASVAKQAGTIYVTTDEHAMYVDIDNNTRIRLGDFIVVDKLENLATAPYQPYSTTALYYIVDKNALARYDGSNWIHINDISALSTSITTLQGVVGSRDAEGNSSGLHAEIDNLQEQIDLLTGDAEGGTSIKTLSDDVAALKTAVGDADSGLVKDNTQNKADIAEAKSDISALETASTTQAAAIEALETKTNGMTDATVQASINTAVNNLANGAVKTNTDNITTLMGEDSVTGSVKQQVKALKDEVANTYATQTALGNLNTTVTSHTGALATLTADATTDGSVAKAQTTANTAKSKAEANEAAIAVLNGDANTAGSVDKKVADAIAASESTTNGTISGLATRMTTAEGEINGLKGLVGSTSVDSQIDTKISNFNTNTVAPLATRVGNVESTVSGHTTTLEDYGTRIGAVETKAANNATAITNLQAETATIDSRIKAAADKALADAKTHANEAVAAEKSERETAVSGEKSRAEAAEQALDKKIENLSTSHSTLTGQFSDFKSEAEADIAALEKATGETIPALIESEINKKLQAADAMTYKGVVNTSDKVLPTANVKIGDTYKVAANGSYSGHTAKIGDLLIATGVEGNDGYLTEIVWDLIPSGGEDDTNPTMSVANNVISLTGAANEALGAVTFAGSVVADTDSGITVKTSDSTISIDMVWGSF